MGLFVTLFLLFFQPFGINNYDPRETISLQFFLLVLTMGSTSVVFMAINELFLYSLIIKKQPKQKELMVWTFWSILWLSGGIFLLYNYLGNWHDFHLTSYLEFVGNTAVLCALPIASIFIYVRIRELRTSLAKAHTYSYQGAIDTSELIVFYADNQKDQFTIPLKFIVYLESEDNYISIHHLDNGSVVKTLLRKNLKRIQQEEHHPALIRCHRSYIINLVHLHKIVGNRNKLDVHLVHLNNTIPVSRQYMDEVYALIS